MQKTADAFRTISEVAQDLDLPQHVLRFWETRFTQIKPLKRGGGRRYYRREDIELLRAIRQLLYGEGYTIKGVQKILKEQGARGIVAAGRRAPTSYDVLPDAAGEAADYSGEGEGEQSRGAEPSVRGPAEYEVLEHLLTELGECERLLGAARAS
jgi:DNA-binding transcriptional MerR regulator